MAEIHCVTAETAGLLGQVADEVFDAPLDPQHLRAYLAEPSHLMLVAVAGGRVVGQCRAIVHLHPDQPPELYIDNLGVTPGHRRQGIGRRLVREMVALGRMRGCQSAWVGTEVDNQPARALYRGFGPGTASVFYLWDIDEEGAD